MGTKELRREINNHTKPCPFCGGYSRTEIQRNFWNGEPMKCAMSYCTECHARGPKVPVNGMSQREAMLHAVDQWNRRYKEETNE